MVRTATTGTGRTAKATPARGTAAKKATGEIADFCARVRYLIDTHDDGNVTAAARRMGIPQRTLAKVYIGETTEPRLGLIQALSRAYRDETLDWIVNGVRGKDDERIAIAAEARARQMLRALSATISEGSPVHAPGAAAKRAVNGR